MNTKNLCKTIPKSSGIYQILNKTNNKFYIGSASNLRRRFSSHKCHLNKNSHSNPHLQNAWNKYGENNFEFLILALCPNEYCLKLEQWFVNNMKPNYNIRKFVHSNKDWHHSEKTKQEIGKKSKELWIKYNGRLTEKCKKAILCYDRNGNFLKEYDSAKSASTELKLFATNITAVLKGKCTFIKNYHFIYKTEIIKNFIKIKDKKENLMKASKLAAISNQKKIQISIKEEFFIFESITKAAKHFNLPITTLSKIKNNTMYLPKNQNSKYKNWKITEIK